MPHVGVLPEDRHRRCVVYAIVCLDNLKVYVGQTVQPLEARWRSHQCEALRDTSDRAICNALVSHGVGKFAVYLLAECASPEDLDREETAFIRLFGSYPASDGAGYNLTLGGRGMWKPAPRVLGKMSASQKKRFSTEESRREVSVKSVAQWADPKAREAMRKIKNDYYAAHPEASLRQSQRMLAVHRADPSMRVRHSAARKLYFAEHPEAAAEHSARMKALYLDNPGAHEILAVAHMRGLRVFCPETRTIYTSLYAAGVGTGANPADVGNVVRRHKGQRTTKGFHFLYLPRFIDFTKCAMLPH